MQNQVTISSTVANFAGGLNSTAVDAAISSSLSSLTKNGSPDNGNRKLLTEEDVKYVNKANLTLLNGFTADSAVIVWNAVSATVGFENLVDTTPEPNVVKKICDLPVRVATSNIRYLGEVGGNITVVCGYGNDTELIANTILEATTIKANVSGTFMRI